MKIDVRNLDKYVDDENDEMSFGHIKMPKSKKIKDDYKKQDNRKFNKHKKKEKDVFDD